ncbi:glycosyltransferase family 4 protein [Actinomyces bowdenii]|uniref:glycosyltransferase family 4 protein n=1 Tax=Actinomyces bowdenii TaxID=131109 RepID=UPI001ABD0D2A|nr:glycosyltransferase family 4 protein [Actinomyces bowdenii]MBO3724260.1 glycosyltransferase family 4 protein [Actinomyces bowdenii]
MSTRQRILEVSGSAAGGVRAHLGDCARLLAGQGHDVIVEAPAAVLEGLEIGGARAEALEIGPRPSPLDGAVVARLRRLGRRADALHAHGLRAGALAALALGRRRPGRTRLVVTLHNLTVGGALTRATGRALERLIASRADLILAVSPDLAQRAGGLGAAEVELAIIPAPRGGSDAGPAAPPHQEPPPDEGPAPGPWPPGHARVLSVARLAPQKGLPLLLEAAAILGRQAQRGELPALSWAVAGEGPGRTGAQERISAEGLPVLLLGRRQDAERLMAGCDVMVQTSVWEGQPLTIQEALRAGAALVATDVGGTAVTARGGATLVEPSAGAIAQAIAVLLRDPRARARARAAARAAAAGLPGDEELAAQLGRVLLARD